MAADGKLSSRLILDHGQLVAALVVVNLVHERADQKQASSADSLKLFGVGRIGQGGDVESSPLVADDESCARPVRFEREVLREVDGGG